MNVCVAVKISEREKAPVSLNGLLLVKTELWLNGCDGVNVREWLNVRELVKGFDSVNPADTVNATEVVISCEEENPSVLLK